MSTVGAYDLHLYCDEPGCNYGDGGEYTYGPRFQQFTGRSESGCIRQARRIGWTINRNREGTLHGGFFARCPQCNQDRRAGVKPDAVKD